MHYSYCITAKWCNSSKRGRGRGGTQGTYVQHIVYTQWRIRAISYRHLRTDRIHIATPCHHTTVPHHSTTPRYHTTVPHHVTTTHSTCLPASLHSLQPGSLFQCCKYREQSLPFYLCKGRPTHSEDHLSCATTYVHTYAAHRPGLGLGCVGLIHK